MSKARQPLSTYSGFIGVGVVFLALGLTSQPAFLGVGAAFLVIGLTAVRKHRVRGP